MSIRSTFIACVTALFGISGCSIAPSPQETEKIIKQIPDHTTTNPKTGCRSIKDEENPDKPQQCLPNEFPQRVIK